MKILLANPATREPISKTKERFFIKAGSRWPWSYVKRRREKNRCCFFPFFLAYTAALLREGGHEVHVIDGVALDMPEEEFLRKVTKIGPGLIAIETATHSIGHDLSLCKKLKKSMPSTKILLCGAHATVFSAALLTDNEFIDFVALGEYEFTVLKVANLLQEGNSNFRERGLGYRKGNEVWVAPEKGFIEDVNVLPSPAFDLFPSNETPDLAVYGDGICTYFPAVTLHSSRGCPFRCDFCMWNQIIYGNGRYRTFEPKRVVDEMEHVVRRYNAKEIYFDDDDFCVHRHHVLGICEEIKKRRLNVKWSCMGDAMSVDEEMIKEMANAGCIFMKFGVESGNTTVLRNIGKPLKPEKAVRVANWCRKHNIMSHATFSLGLDGESLETMKDTLNLAKKIKFDTAQVSIATPFPGTKFYQKLLSRGFIGEVEWDTFDGTMTCAFDTNHLTSAEVESFRKRAVRTMVFHRVLDPVWMVRFVRRNLILLRNYGFGRVFEPMKALLRL